MQSKWNLFMEALGENLPMLLGGAVGIVSGVILLFDDISDFGKVDRPHHYHWGILLLIGGALLLAIGLARLILRLCAC
jgi:drug/metabolite transporter (DMT)-like permease